MFESKAKTFGEAIAKMHYDIVYIFENNLLLIPAQKIF